MPFNYKLIGFVKQAASRLNAKMAGEIIPGPDYKNSLPNKPAPYNPNSPIKFSPKYPPPPGTSPGPQPPVVGQLYGASPGAQLGTMQIPKSFANNAPVLETTAKENYGLHSNSARLANHQAINNNIQDPVAYNQQSIDLANQGLANRSATPWYIKRTDRGSSVIVNENPEAIRAMNIEHNDWNLDKQPDSLTPDFGRSRGVVIAHEGTHMGEQAAKDGLEHLSHLKGEFPHIEYLSHELPAVSSELVNSAQAAYLSNNQRPKDLYPSTNGTYDYRAAYPPKPKPLEGTFSLGGRPVPWEMVRKYVESHGHTGGDFKTTMTELINSPNGQRYLEGQMRDINRGYSPR